MRRVIYVAHAVPSESGPPLSAPSEPVHASALPSDKRRYVREMFRDIAPRYDLLNRVLSASIDQSWRRAAVRLLDWERRPDGLYLDACAGTLDLAAALAHEKGFTGRVVATDFVLPMLKRGRAKPPAGSTRCAVADTLEIPVADATFDGAMVGFGIRNLADLDTGLRELARVVRPGARLVLLDFATPAASPLRGLYLLYFHRVLPLVGRLISGHPTAYSYLPESVEEFPAPADLEQRLVAAGFGFTGHRLLTSGIAAITWGER
jgi:demethylmenaquinone methyltransferase/2-methoxy-6-polyprenyl-1,4-benzoquinol methylase